MAQAIPKDDTFDEAFTADVYGTGLLEYLGCVPTTAYTYGLLCDFDNDDQPSVHGRDGAALTQSAGILWRRTDVPLDCRVDCWSAIAPESFQELGSLMMGEFGVIARYQNGTLTGDGTADVRLINGDCYIFSVEGDFVNALALWRLRRVKAGVSTTIGSFVQPLASIPTDFTKPLGLRLDVTNVFGVVLLQAYISNVSVSGVVVQGFKLLEIIDVAPNYIDAIGRAGMLLPQDRLFTIALGFDIPTRQKCSLFQVSTAAGAVVHRDEWKRVRDASALQDINDYGASGGCVQSGWYHDQLTLASSPAPVFRLTRSTVVADAVRITNTGLASSGIQRAYMLAQRPADNTRSQRRAITVTLNADGSGDANEARAVGLILRASASQPSYLPPVDPFAVISGYVGWVERTTAGFTAQVWRQRNSVATMLGSVSVGGLALGTPFEVELEVAPDLTSGTLSGPALLTLYVNGAQQVLATSGGVLGVTIDGFGVVRDASDQRITAGPAEGIAYRIQAGGAANNSTADVAIWEQGVLPVLTDTPAKDQASIAVENEGASEATLEFLPDYPAARASEWFVRRQPFESGHVQTTAGREAPRYTWSLSRQGMTAAEHTALVAFFRARRGPEGAFTWVDPESGSSYKVAFVDGSLDSVQQFRGVWAVSFQLLELR